MMKTERFPVTVSESGVSAKIRKYSRLKSGKTYASFIVEYFLLGKLKQVSRAGFEEAKTVALEACRAISRGQQASLSLANGERLEYLRATEALAPVGVKLDVAAHEYASAMTLLAGRATITAHAGWGAANSTYTTETPENIWELDPNDTDKSLLEADFPNGSVNLDSVTTYSSSHITKQAIKEALDDDGPKWVSPLSGVGSVKMTTGRIYIFDSGGVNDNASIDLNVYYCPTDDYASAYSLYLLLKANVTSFPISAPVIRHTQLVSNLWTVQASYINCDRIISSSSMSSVEGVPGTLLFAVPVPPIVSQFIEVPGDLAYGWRKIFPNVTRLARFKWRIVQNWQFGLWPTKLAGGTI